MIEHLHLSLYFDEVVEVWNIDVSFCPMRSVIERLVSFYLNVLDVQNTVMSVMRMLHTQLQSILYDGSFGNFNFDLYWQ